MLWMICDLFQQEGRHDEALRKFTQVQNIGGYKPDLAYNIALCNYMLKQFAAAHSCVGDIIARGIKEHPGKMITFWTSCLILHSCLLNENLTFCLGRFCIV